MPRALRATLIAFAFLLPVLALAAPWASAGRMDLSRWQFDRDGPVELAGDWEFAADRLVGGAEPWPGDARLLRAPGPWQSVARFGYGAGTYRLRVDCSASEPLALIVPYQHSAAAVFVNGRQVATHGQPGLTRETQHARIEEQFAPLDAVRCPLDVRVQVSNFDQHTGGMVRGLQLGEREQLRRLREVRSFMDVAVMACLALIGVFALHLYARRPRDTTGLVLGVFCLGFVVIVGTYYERVLGPWLPASSFDGQIRTLWAAFYLFSATWPLLVRSLYPRQAPRGAALFLASFCAGGFLVCALLPIRWSASAAPFTWLVPPLIGAFVVAVLARACMKRERGARIVLVGSILLNLAGYADMWGSVHLFGASSTRLMPVGVLAFALATALLLTDRFIRALRAEELRGIELRERADLLVRTTQAGVLDWDTSSGQWRASERYREMLRLPPADAAPLPELQALLHPQDRDSVHGVIAAHLRQRAQGLHRWKPMEFRMLRGDGQTVWVHAEAISIHGADGGPLRHICTFIDITHLKSTQEQLREAQSRLLEEARRAGMAQIATNVLHNVGNVLTSVNVSTHVLADRVRRSVAGRVGDVAGLLESGIAQPQSFFGPGAKGRQVPGYLRELSQALVSERAQLLAEIDRLAASVEHIKNVVAMQQSYASSGHVFERERLDVIVDDALRLQEASLARHRVTVRREYDTLEPVPVDRTRCMQILVNLIDNARDAMDAVPGERLLRVALRRSGDGRVAMSVSDNGCGIAPDHLARLFSHAFTTKPGGHGFGLHSCAVAAREMGGRLSAHSDGPGDGATFTLELRAEPEDAGARAPREASEETLVVWR